MVCDGGGSNHGHGGLLAAAAAAAALQNPHSSCKEEGLDGRLERGEIGREIF